MNGALEGHIVLVTGAAGTLGRAMCEAIEQAGKDSAARLAKSSSMRQAQGASAFRAFVENYLSERHLASPESGCPVAALASEMPRQSPAVGQAASQRVRGLIAAVQSALPPAASRDAAAAIASQLVGALQLARALGDNAEGKAVLAATRRTLLARYDTAASR